MPHCIAITGILFLGLASSTIQLASDAPQIGVCNTAGRRFRGTVSAEVTCPPPPPPPSSVPRASAPAAPRCTWSPAQGLTEIEDAYNTPSPDGRTYRDAATHQRVDRPGPGTQMLYVINCVDGSASYRYGDLADYIDPQVVIDAAYAQMTAYLPEPTPAMWPPPEVGAPVQLGLWLAVADPGQINAFANVGPVWASVTATPSTTAFDMGNGESVACDGLGTAYVAPADPTDYRPGPCGYTYRTVADLGARHVTITSTWAVHLTTSTGIDRALDPVTTTTGFDYEVYEIPTVVLAGV